MKTTILCITLLLIGTVFSVYASKQGLVSAWLFEDGGGVDGKLDGQAKSGGKLSTSETPIWIGARPGNVAATGLIDEVGFFTKALTENQVNDVMNDGLESYAAVEAAGKVTTTWGLLKTR